MNARRTRGLLSVLLVLALVPLFAVGAAAGDGPVVEMRVEPGQIVWQPQVGYAQAVLSVETPEGHMLKIEFEAGSPPTLGLVDAGGQSLPDGVYHYELRFLPAQEEAREEVVSGSFVIREGGFGVIEDEEVLAGPDAPLLYTHSDDVLIEGYLELEDYTPTIYLDDADVGATDWEIRVREAAPNWLSIWETTSGTYPFRIEATAPSYTLLLDENGNVGMGTSNPQDDLHIVDANPTIRLDDSSTAEPDEADYWDIQGYEDYFRIRYTDNTSANYYPFLIMPGAGDFRLNIMAGGKVGVKTTDPKGQLHAVRAGKGQALYGQATSYTATNYGVYGRTESNQGTGVFGVARSATGDTYGVYGKSRSETGTGVYGYASSTSGKNVGVYGTTDSDRGWAGRFETTVGKGVYISAPAGNRGLLVASGTKSAVVATDDGSRLLYAEESTEVWFSDHGFGQLVDGVARVPIDPLYAQTVNLSEPYLVFLEEYGPAEIYVAERTPEWFEVRVLQGDADVAFGYRLMAKRLGYEQERLEREPSADADPNLYPEKQAEWQAKHRKP